MKHSIYGIAFCPLLSFVLLSALRLNLFLFYVLFQLFSFIVVVYQMKRHTPLPFTVLESTLYEIYLSAHRFAWESHFSISAKFTPPNVFILVFPNNIFVVALFSQYWLCVFRYFSLAPLGWAGHDIRATDRNGEMMQPRMNYVWMRREYL